MISIVDSSALYAAIDDGDKDHARCVDLLQRAQLRPVVPTMVVAEVTYMVGKRLGPRVEATFLRGLEEIDVEAPEPEDWRRIAELVDGYRDFPLGGTDASVVALAERLDTDVVITLDHRHFGAIQPRHRPAFRLLPE